jgi:hypothetical protein
MKSFDDVFAAIESPRFAAEVNLASSLPVFDRILRSLRPFRRANELMIATGADRTIYDRLKMLVTRPTDPKIENPYDAALAAYVRLLDTFDSAFVSAATRDVATCPNCNWARVVAEELESRDGSSVANLQCVSFILPPANTGYLSTHLTENLAFVTGLLSSSGSESKRSVKRVELPTTYHRQPAIEMADETTCWRDRSQFANVADTQEVHA